MRWFARAGALRGCRYRRVTGREAVAPCTAHGPGDTGYGACSAVTMKPPLSFVCAMLLPLGGLTGQCQFAWAPGDGLPGTSGRVEAAVAWDPDGSGPQPERILMAGWFEAGGDARGGVVAYDPMQRTWQSFGGRTDQAIYALLPLPNGELIAAGAFTTIDGVAASHVARFDGTAWRAMGGGLDQAGHSLALLPNGDVAVGGWFSLAGGVAAPGLARWDGVGWSPLASSVAGYVEGVMRAANGDLVVHGDFSDIGGVAARNLATFDGQTWSALATSVDLRIANWPHPAVGTIAKVLPLANGDLLAFGSFDAIDGVQVANAARFDGQTWTRFAGVMTPRDVDAAAELANGDIVASGPWRTTHTATEVRRFDGSTWVPLGAGMANHGGSSALCRPLVVSAAGELFGFGQFTSADGRAARNAARWDGGVWRALSPGTDNGVRALRSLAGGDLIAGGHFTSIGGAEARGIARYDGTAWAPIAGDVDGVVSCVTQTPSGEIVIAGHFTGVAGVTAYSIARYDGVQWRPMSSGVNGHGASAAALAALPNGDVVVAGAFPQVGGVPSPNIARWNGTSWHSMAGGTNFLISALAVLPNGDLVAAGDFSVAGGTPAMRVARWDGVAWHALGAGLPFQVLALAVSGDGVLHAGYGHSALGAVARWNGSAWQQVGGLFDRYVSGLAFLPDGSLMATGHFSNVAGQPASGLARWGGSSWSGVAPGLQDPRAEAIAVRPDGDVVVGGWFVSGGAPGNSYIARLQPTCRATAASVGVGCVGAAGTVALAAEQLPWLGGSLRSVATGVPASSIAVEVLGLGALAAPLSSLLPQGLPGCDLLVTPDLLALHLPNGGEVRTAMPLPLAPALVGRSFRQQVVVVEVAATITGLSSSNALLLTVGSY